MTHNVHEKSSMKSRKPCKYKNNSLIDLKTNSLTLKVWMLNVTWYSALILCSEHLNDLKGCDIMSKLEQCMYKSVGICKDKYTIRYLDY